MQMAERKAAFLAKAPTIVVGAVLGVFVFLSASTAKAAEAELLYYFSELCEYCEKWDAEIGAYYNKTEEARTLPLRRVDADEESPGDIAHIDNVVFTPTFVAYRDGREVGRIVGYIDEDFFWGYLQPLIKKVRLADGGGETVNAASRLIRSGAPQDGAVCVTC